MNKHNFKRLSSKCQLCDVDVPYELLDVHRIDEGGEYIERNCLAICVKCHRSHHSGLLKIKEKRFSTVGWVVIYEQDGNEKIKPIY